MTDHEKACFDRAASELAKRGAHGEANLADALTKLGAALLESDSALAAEREHADGFADRLAEALRRSLDIIESYTKEAK